MCTAISFTAKEHYFGRNLDVEGSYREQIVITPRRFAWCFRHLPPLTKHYAMIGTATVVDGIPLYFDATNEQGLSMAGLRFAENAAYFPPKQGHTNVASFELIPWILGTCATTEQAQAMLKDVCITDECFHDGMPASPLHWLIVDQNRSMVVEQTKRGLAVVDNPVGVLTNNPPFDKQWDKLNDYMALSPRDPHNTFAPALSLKHYSRGMGAWGLPGDFSSSSRFVRAAFVKTHIAAGGEEADSVGQFFRILDAVAQPRGCVILPDGQREFTSYSSCCNTARGVYYYKTYENSGLSCVNMYAEDLDEAVPICYPFLRRWQVTYQNKKQ